LETRAWIKQDIAEIKNFIILGTPAMGSTFPVTSLFQQIVTVERGFAHSWSKK